MSNLVLLPLNCLTVVDELSLPTVSFPALWELVGIPELFQIRGGKGCNGSSFVLCSFLYMVGVYNVPSKNPFYL